MTYVCDITRGISICHHLSTIFFKYIFLYPEYLHIFFDLSHVTMGIRSICELNVQVLVLLFIGTELILRHYYLHYHLYIHFYDDCGFIYPYP